MELLHGCVDCPESNKLHSFVIKALYDMKQNGRRTVGNDATAMEAECKEPSGTDQCASRLVD